MPADIGPNFFAALAVRPQLMNKVAMKLHLLIALASLGALPGYESLSHARDDLRAKLAERSAPRVKTFPAPPKVTYEAVRTAVGQMGYRILRGGQAQGELDAIAGVGPGESNRSSRQLVMKVRLHAALDAGNTEVSVRLTEIIESESANRSVQTTEAPLRDTPQYDVFFRAVQQVLNA